MSSIFQVAGCLLLLLGLTLPYSGLPMDSRTRSRIRAGKMFSAAALVSFLGSLTIQAIKLWS